MKTLYVFIDESGNFDFSNSGTKYFILTALSTINPYDISAPLLKHKYDLLPNYACGTSMEERGYFHASEDMQTVRDSVFSILIKNGHQMRIDSVVAQKNKANPIFHSQPVQLYLKMGGALLKYSFKSLIKMYAKTTFALYFHDSKFDFCNQAVDYFGWAIYRKWEVGDVRSYDLVKHIIKSEFPIFAKGTHLFY